MYLSFKVAIEKDKKVASVEKFKAYRIQQWKSASDLQSRHERTYKWNHPLGLYRRFANIDALDTPHYLPR